MARHDYLLQIEYSDCKDYPISVSVYKDNAGICTFRGTVLSKLLNRANNRIVKEETLEEGMVTS